MNPRKRELFDQSISVGQIEKNEMGKICSTNGEKQKLVQCCGGET
jgi:hypothetical protein